MKGKAFLFKYGKYLMYSNYFDDKVTDRTLMQASPWLAVTLASKIMRVHLSGHLLRILALDFGGADTQSLTCIARCPGVEDLRFSACSLSLKLMQLPDSPT